MGISCKPYGKWKSVMTKLDNKIRKEQEAAKAKAKPAKEKKEDK